MEDTEFGTIPYCLQKTVFYTLYSVVRYIGYIFTKQYIMKCHRDNEITQTLRTTQCKILGLAKNKFRDDINNQTFQISFVAKKNT